MDYFDSCDNRRRLNRRAGGVRSSTAHAAHRTRVQEVKPGGGITNPLLENSEANKSA